MGTIRIALEGLLANRFRAFLTILGMVIGVFSVVVLVSLGQGAKNYVLSEFQGLGSNLIIIQPGKTDRKSRFSHPVGISQKKMTEADVIALQRKAFHLEAVTGVVFGSSTARYAEASNNISVFGCNEQFPQIISVSVGSGSFFNKEEVEFGRRVAVIGSKVAENLFGNEEPLGKPVKLGESEFRVIGVLANMGDKLGINFDEFAFIPTSSALKLFNEDKLFGIRAKSLSKSSSDAAVEEVRSILLERRDGEEDFTIITQTAIMDSMGTILGMLTFVLGGIAGISMLVGGIGIMNMMLVSVTERISEIGIRRAVGATRGDILRQFLYEALVLSLLSGILGLCFAGIATAIISSFTGSFRLTPPLWIIPLAALLCLAVGVFFGLWPARKAASIEVLDALRHE